MKKDDHLLVISGLFYVVTSRYTRPFRYSTISDPPSFELPYTLSTNVIGTCRQAQDPDQLKGGRSMSTPRKYIHKTESINTKHSLS
jgi:hypothetical protein